MLSAAIVPRASIVYKHTLDTKAHITPRESFTQSFRVHISTNFTKIVMVTDARATTLLGLRILGSTRPVGTAPIPPNFIDNMEGQAQKFVSWMSWWKDVKTVQNYKQHGSTGTVIFTGDFPSPEPTYVSIWF